MLLWTFYDNSEVLCIPNGIPPLKITIHSHTWKEIEILINLIHVFYRRESLDSEAIFAGYNYRNSQWYS